MTLNSSMDKTRAFPGRILFDHLPKTAGTAISTWLTDALGTGCVSPQVNGLHRKVIAQYGGTYSIISAHVDFDMGEMRDPRYQYVTCLREPVDRAVSWLYYVLEVYRHVPDSKLFRDVSRLIESDGKDLDAELIPSISNLYVNHFSRIGVCERSSGRLSAEHCVEALAGYDLVGIQEALPAFLNAFGRLIGIPPVREIPDSRVTPNRPRLGDVPCGLKSRLVELNQLDSQLYGHVKAWAPGDAWPPPVAFQRWQKYERASEVRVVTSPDLIVDKVDFPQGPVVEYGQMMTFAVEFFVVRKLSELAIGIHILDEERRLAFGTNSMVLGQHHGNVASGTYGATFGVVAELPVGKYSIGFWFTESSADGTRELAWNDVACEFRVRRLIEQRFAGYTYLPTQFTLAPMRRATDGSVSLCAV
jgi:hypothetical protein